MKSESSVEGPVVSIVTFALNERENLPLLHERILAVMQNVDASWELVVVDDHSGDGTFEYVKELAGRDPRVRGIRLSRHFGSHAARMCGLSHARGACAVTLAADLQDPPAIIPEMITKWREGAQLVAGVRVTRKGESLAVRIPSRLYKAMMRRILGVPDGIPTLTGYCLLDRRVIDACMLFPETNTSSIALLQWMGFRLARVEYDQQRRMHGRSNWTFARKAKLTIDSVTAFSPTPIRLMTYAGLIVFLLGIVIGVMGFGATGIHEDGSSWTILLTAVLLLAGVQMGMMGILGEYLWRILADARRRPQYLIEEVVGFSAQSSRRGEAG